MGKTLIIHPKDRSTTFLDIVYESVVDKTVITGGISKEEVNELIKEHDRVMMMGHGCPDGLFSVGQFQTKNGLIVDYNTVNFLKENSVFIWCNADRFVRKHNLKGFFSGMFISEVGEANYCGVYGTDQEIVNESNLGFCNIIAKYINEKDSIIHENVVKEYGVIAENNPVALYNNNRLHLNL
jgi:hypothetical protein